MAIGTEGLMHECFHKHSRMGTAKMKKRQGNRRLEKDVSIEKSKVGTKEKRSPELLNYPNQNTIIINIIC